MTITACRGVVKSGVVLLADSGVWADDTEVLVIPAASQRGSSAAVLAAVLGPPHLTPSEVDELEQAIAHGRRPLSAIDLFPADEERAENP
jgi:hypothetical protein